MKRKLFFLSFLLIPFLNLHAQKISGIVTDASDKQPIIGATVRIKDASGGTTTDLNGKYSINVPAHKKILVFQYIGYQSKEVKIEKDTILNISLTHSNSDLKEVVVIGHGAQKKQNITGSVSTVRTEVAIGNSGISPRTFSVFPDITGVFHCDCGMQQPGNYFRHFPNTAMM